MMPHKLCGARSARLVNQSASVLILSALRLPPGVVSAQAERLCGSLQVRGALRLDCFHAFPCQT